MAEEKEEVVEEQPVPVSSDRDSVKEPEDDEGNLEMSAAEWEELTSPEVYEGDEEVQSSAEEKPEEVVEEPQRGEEPPQRAAPPSTLPVEETPRAETPPPSTSGTEVKPEVPEEEPAEEVVDEEAFAQQRQQAIDELEKQYALDEDAASMAMTEPEQFLPKFAARLYIDVYERVMRDVAMNLPGYFDRLTKAQQVRQDNESAFFKKWPALKDKKYESTVTRIANTYRGLNPNADLSTFINEVGAQAMVALKLPIPGHKEEMDEEVITPFRPQSTTPKAVTPKKAGVSPSRNMFEEMAEEFLQDDESYGN